MSDVEAEAEDELQDLGGAGADHLHRLYLEEGAGQLADFRLRLSPADPVRVSEATPSCSFTIRTRLSEILLELAVAQVQLYQLGTA